MKKLILTLLILLPIGLSAQQSFVPNLYPFADSQYYLGTTTGAFGLKAWLRVIADSFYDTDATDGCAEWSSNVLVSTGSACGSGGGGGGGGTFSTTTSQVSGQLINYPNNATDIVNIGSNSTTTGEFWFDPNALFAKIGAQLLVTSSTTLQNFTGINATTSQATTTSFAISGITSAIPLTNANGSFAEYAGTSCTNQFVRSLSALGVATCATVANTDLANSTISGISLGSNLNSLSNGSTLLGTSYNGSATVSDWDIDLSNQNIWTSASTTFVGGVTIGTATTTNATTTGFAVSGITSAIPLTNAGGSFLEYAGTSCTNQLVRSLSALGVATCATIVATDVDLADLTATDTTLTFSGTYDGQTARTIGVNLGANFAWTGNQDFGGAAFLEVPNGANPTANDPGEIAHDTTDNQLILDDFVVARATERIWGVTVASTSPYFIGGANLAIPTQADGYTMTSIKCHVVSGTSKAIQITDGTNATESITCGTTVTSDDGSITNASVTADELMYIDFGSTSGSVDTVSISVFGQWTRE